MITAREAREITNSTILSSEEIEQIKNIIVSTAEKGMRSVELNLLWLTYSRPANETWGVPAEKLSLESNKMAVARRMLENNGYTVNVKTQEPYVPRGLADDDGNGPMYCNVVLEVSW